MTILQFCNRASRNLQSRDILEMALDDQQSVLDCINAAAKTLHSFLPVHHKHSTEGATLGPPVAVSLGTLPALVAGRSVMITGDVGLNRYRTDWSSSLALGADLLFTAPGTSGTLYDDVIRLSGRVKSVNSVRIPGNVTPLGYWDENEPPSMDVGVPTYYRVDPVSPADRATNEAQGIFTMGDLASYLRVWPLPSASTRIAYSVEYGPLVLTLSDIARNVSSATGTITESPALPILDTYLADFLLLAEEELSSLSIYAGDKQAAEKAGARAQLRLSGEPNHLDAGKPSRRGTPENW